MDESYYCNSLFLLCNEGAMRCFAQKAELWIARQTRRVTYSGLSNYLPHLCPNEALDSLIELYPDFDDHSLASKLVNQITGNASLLSLHSCLEALQIYHPEPIVVSKWISPLRNHQTEGCRHPGDDVRKEQLSRSLFFSLIEEDLFLGVITEWHRQVFEPNCSSYNPVFTISTWLSCGVFLIACLSHSSLTWATQLKSFVATRLLLSSLSTIHSEVTMPVPKVGSTLSVLVEARRLQWWTVLHYRLAALIPCYVHQSVAAGYRTSLDSFLWLLDKWAAASALECETGLWEVLQVSEAILCDAFPENGVHDSLAQRHVEKLAATLGSLISTLPIVMKRSEASMGCAFLRPLVNIGHYFAIQCATLIRERGEGILSFVPFLANALECVFDFHGCARLDPDQRSRSSEHAAAMLEVWPKVANLVEILSALSLPSTRHMKASMLQSGYYLTLLCESEGLFLANSRHSMQFLFAFLRSWQEWVPHLPSTALQQFRFPGQDVGAAVGDVLSRVWRFVWRDEKWRVLSHQELMVVTCTVLSLEQKLRFAGSGDAQRYLLHRGSLSIILSVCLLHIENAVKHPDPSRPYHAASTTHAALESERVSRLHPSLFIDLSGFLSFLTELDCQCSDAVRCTYQRLRDIWLFTLPSTIQRQVDDARNSLLERVSEYHENAGRCLWASSTLPDHPCPVILSFGGFPLGAASQRHRSLLSQSVYVWESRKQPKLVSGLAPPLSSVLASRESGIAAWEYQFLFRSMAIQLRGLAEQRIKQDTLLGARKGSRSPPFSQRVSLRLKASPLSAVAHGELERCFSVFGLFYRQLALTVHEFDISLLVSYERLTHVLFTRLRSAFPSMFAAEAAASMESWRNYLSRLPLNAGCREDTHWPDDAERTLHLSIQQSIYLLRMLCQFPSEAFLSGMWSLLLSVWKRVAQHVSDTLKESNASRSFYWPALMETLTASHHLLTHCEHFHTLLRWICDYFLALQKVEHTMLLSVELHSPLGLLGGYCEASPELGIALDSTVAVSSKPSSRVIGAFTYLKALERGELNIHSSSAATLTFQRFSSQRSTCTSQREDMMADMLRRCLDCEEHGESSAPFLVPSPSAPSPPHS